MAASLLTNRARAYVNHGRWIADCTRPHCANAEKLAPWQATFHCSNCRQVAEVEWPGNADELWAVLELRPVPQTRNWFPTGHELALRSGIPHGQSVADLEDENREYGVI
jgi:hypothetical protein